MVREKAMGELQRFHVMFLCLCSDIDDPINGAQNVTQQSAPASWRWIGGASVELLYDWTMPVHDLQCTNNHTACKVQCYIVPKA